MVLDEVPDAIGRRDEVVASEVHGGASRRERPIAHDHFQVVVCAVSMFVSPAPILAMPATWITVVAHAVRT